MHKWLAVLLCLGLPVIAQAQADCSEPGALIYDDGGFENGLGTSSSFLFVHIAQLMEPASASESLTSFCFCFSRIPGGSSSVDIDVSIWAADGPGGAPGTLLATLDNAPVTGIATFPSVTWRRINLTEPFDPGGDFYVGPVWQDPDIFLCSDESFGTPLWPGYIDIDILAGLQTPVAQLGVDLADSHRAAGIRSIMTEVETQPSLDEASLILPGWDYDTQNAGGRTTFFTIANHLSSSQGVGVQYFGKSLEPGPVSTSTFTVAAKETRPVDIRSQGLGSLAGSNGIASGLALIGQGENTSISGDFQRVNFDSDFATGDRLVRPSDFCNELRHRFLDFGSGTKFQILLNRPPTSGTAFSYVAFDEAGNQVASGTRSPGVNLFSTTAAALVTGTNFGAIEFDLTPSGGGAVFAEYSAFGRFSLESAAECLDSSPGLRFTPYKDETPARSGAFNFGLLGTLR